MSPRVGASLSGVSGGAAALAAAPLEFTPSEQQLAVLNWVKLGRGNAIVEARAGSGKTSTLRAIAQSITGQAAFLAFNKSIAKEIESKLLAAGLDWQRVKSGTFHSFGLNAWNKTAGRPVQVDGKKLDTICGQLQIPKMYWPFVRDAVSKAKQHLFGAASYPALDSNPDWLDLVEHYDISDKLAGDEETTATPDELLAYGLMHAMRALRLSNDRGREVVDFDDMIYLPILNNAKFWQYDWVLVDEAQDTNPARLEMASRLLKPGGRLVAVGDPFQAIYGFTGASADALDQIATRLNATRLPLTVTFRCSQQVTLFAQRWVADIEAPPTAPSGSVRAIDVETFERLAFERTDAILCRNTKPLVEYAFHLIRRGIGCHVEGRDIGQGLVAFVNKWKSVRTVADLRAKLYDHLQEEMPKLLASGKELQAESLEDKVETLLVLCDRAHDDDDKQEVIKAINLLFQDTAGERLTTVTLSTVHKAKGREWQRVYLLGRDKFMPSRFAKQQWQKEQEKNLIYVAVTRAQIELVEVFLTMKATRELAAAEAKP